MWEIEGDFRRGIFTCVISLVYKFLKYVNFCVFAVWAETGDFRDPPHSHNTSMDHNQTTSFIHARNNRMRDRKGNVFRNFFHRIGVSRRIGVGVGVGVGVAVLEA